MNPWLQGIIITVGGLLVYEFIIKDMVSNQTAVK
jgi:hypothetical protein